MNGVTVNQLDELVAPDRLPSHPRNDRHPLHTANHPLDVEQFLSGPGDEQRIASLAAASDASRPSLRPVRFCQRPPCP